MRPGLLPLLLLTLLSACDDWRPANVVPRPDAGADAGADPAPDAGVDRPAADRAADRGLPADAEVTPDAGTTPASLDGPPGLPPTSSDPAALPLRRCAWFGMGAIHALRFTPGGAQVAVLSSEPPTLSLVHPQSGEVQQNVDLSAVGPMRLATFSADGGTLLVVGRQVMVWRHPFGGAPTVVPAAEPGSVSAAALSGDGRMVALRSYTGPIDLRRLPDGTSLRLIESGGIAVARTAVALSPDGAILAVRGASEVGAFRTADGGRLWSVAAPALADPGPMVFSADGTLLAFDPHAPQVVRVSDGSAVLTLATQRAIAALAFSPDARRLLSVGAVESRLWDLATGMPAGAHPAGSAGAFSPDGESFALGAAALTVHRSADGQVAARNADWSLGRVRSMSFSPDGRRLLVANQTSALTAGAVKEWDLASRRAARTFTGGWQVAHSADGEYLGMFEPGGPERPLRLLRLADGQWQTSARGALHFAFAGALLVTQERRGPLTVRRIGDQAVVRVVPAREPTVEDPTLAVSRDATLLAYFDPTTFEVVITRVADGTPVRRIRVAQTLVDHALAFSADGKLLAVGSEVFRTADGQSVLGLSDPRPAAVAFSPAADILAVSNGTLTTLWRPGGPDRPMPTRLEAPGQRLAFSPDGGYLATSSGAAVTLWCRD